MRAIIWERYGPPDVLRIGELPKPVPKHNEVLIKVHCSTVTQGDCELRRFDIAPWIWLPLRIFTGLFKPRIKVLGQEYAGVVEDVGSKVTKFRKGDRVFGAPRLSHGSYCEYICLPEAYPIARIPDNVNYESAATLTTGGINGLHFLTKAKIKAEESVLINGAGGSIGTYALQIAKLWGAEVTCVDSSEKFEMLQSLGADHLIDFQKEDFTKNDKKYDIVIDVVGKSSFGRCIQTLNDNGRYVLGNPSFMGMIRGLFVRHRGKRVLYELAAYKSEYYDFLRYHLAAGKIKSEIDKRFALEQIVDAHRYVEAGQKKGNVIITITEL